MHGHDFGYDSGWLLPQALNPVERFRAAKDWSGGPSMDARWLWAAVALALLIAAIVLVAVLIWRKVSALRRQREAFHNRLRQLGLSDREQTVLSAIAQAARASKPSIVLADRKAFERGAAALLSSPRVAGLSAERRATVSDVIDSLRQVLLFGQDAEEEADSPGEPLDDAAEAEAAVAHDEPAERAEPGEPYDPGEPRIAEGDRLTVVFRGEAAAFDLDVIDTRDGELLVEPAAAVDPRAGETWLLRFSTGGQLWEFDAPVVGGSGGRVLLRRPRRLRFINRRRFPRVPTDKPAMLAPFPLWRSDVETDMPEFIEGRLVEIAGPGLRLEASADVKVGQRVLVAVRLGDGNVIEGVGEVRRRTDTGAGSQLVVELVGLHEQEVARLTQATNAAARAAARGAQDEDEQAVAAVGTGPAAANRES